SLAVPPTSRLRVKVPSEAAGLRLDRFLAGIPEVGSRAAADRLLASSSVLVDGAGAGKSARLSGGGEPAGVLARGGVLVEGAEAGKSSRLSGGEGVEGEGPGGRPPLEPQEVG